MLKKLIPAVVVAASVLIPSTLASASPVVPERGQSWVARPEATTPCPSATSHLWCGLANNDGAYDRTYRWWEIGLGPIVNHGHLPEPTLIRARPIGGYSTGPVMPPTR